MVIRFNSETYFEIIFTDNYNRDNFDCYFGIDYLTSHKGSGKFIY